LATPALDPLQGSPADRSPDPESSPVLGPLTSVTVALPRGRSFVHTSVLTFYRLFAIVVLYSVLIGIFTYAFIMGFYALNSTWAAPVIISASDEKSLDYLAQLVTSQQTIEDLKVDVVHQQTTLAEMTKHRASLEALDPEIDGAIAARRPEPAEGSR